MKVIKVKNYDEVSAEAFKVMKEVVANKPEAVLGLATGRDVYKRQNQESLSVSFLQAYLAQEDKDQKEGRQETVAMESKEVPEVSTTSQPQENAKTHLEATNALEDNKMCIRDRLGSGPIMKINQSDNSVMIHRMGRIPAPLQSLKN